MIAPEQLVIGGPWEFQLKPTLDNQWGDFRLPATDRMIGAEARIFRYAPERQPNPGWQKPDLDDSAWQRVTYGFGQKFWKLGPLPDDIDHVKLQKRLATIKYIDPSVSITVNGKEYLWTPYEFSWRWGVENDPGHQGYHGLKENITDDFICLGKPQNGLNQTLYVREQQGSRYYLWTSAVASQDTHAKIIAAGLTPAAVYVNGVQLTDLKKVLPLQSGANPLLIYYDKPGRGHFVLERTDSAQPISRTPLSMQWYDRPGRLPFDIRGSEAVPAGWYRFTAPPGLRAMTATVRGKVQAWADGTLLKVAKQQVLPCGAIQYRLRLEHPITSMAKVALRIEPDHGYYGGSTLPEPIALECDSGSKAVGDWSRDSVLECYSGGAWYRKTVTLTSEQIGNRVLLNMGDVVATAEVHINGRLAGIRVSPPWKVDISGFLKPGENRFEILVYNTLANHYLTIPTRYRGSLRSGLMGPVSLEFDQPAVPAGK